jgi:HTH-type transcriptional regulator / antitoxin HipB
MLVRSASDVGRSVRDRRRKLGLSQADLAKRAGVTRQWILALEAGKSTAELGLVLSTLQALGLRISVHPVGGVAPPPGTRPDLDAILKATLGDPNDD